MSSPACSRSVTKTNGGSWENGCPRRRPLRLPGSDCSFQNLLIRRYDGA